MSRRATRDLVAQLLPEVPLDDVLTALEGVAAYDRYQASRGIELAAQLVAERAEAGGLADVSVTSFPADGAARWWTFRAPVAWTPTAARLELRAADGRAVAVDHAEQPFAVATYSAPTPPGGVTAPIAEGAIEIGPEPSPGALGFLSGEGEHRRRIELDPETPQFAFSLTAAELEVAKTAREAHAVVEVDRSARMPSVTGVLPGERDDGEIWLTGHLCHPRPGANDNASGVAALLGVASVLARTRGERTIRFVWAPEFAGTAAVLHGALEAGCRPVAVLNLDMVGEDQTLCGGPFVVERAPESRPTLLTPLVEDVVASVFEETAGEPGTWRPAPFLGSSDHAVFADPRFGCAAVQLCHATDVFNHSAADSVDKVSEVELLRAVAAAAAGAAILSGRAHVPLGPLVDGWCANEEAAAGGDGEWGRRLGDYLGRLNDAMRSLAADGRLARPGNGVLPRWPGPINVRALLADLSPATRAEVTALIAADKRDYGVLLDLAIRADGARPRHEIVEETSFALRRPLDPRVATTLFDALLESGWVA
jgi:hypothetical protein